MSSRQLYPDGAYLFRDRAGCEFEGGKSYYPALVTVRMDRRRALDILHQLATYLHYDLEAELDLTFSGTIERTEDGDEQGETP